MTKKRFQKIIYDHYKYHERRLPWRLVSSTPYHIMVSEIMLQQTQVERVIPKYKKFIKKFPTIKKLSRASLKEIFTVWQGLGYNKRALMLKKTAEKILKEHNGRIPKTEKDLVSLPGIGTYTARAILTFSYDQPHYLIETNIRSVYIHHFFKNKKDITDDQLLPHIKKTFDETDPKKWCSALMDYGSVLKNKEGNPNKKSKHYTKQSSFKDSDRKIRGEIIRLLTSKIMTEKTLMLKTKTTKSRMRLIVSKMEKESLIHKNAQKYTIA